MARAMPCHDMLCNTKTTHTHTHTNSNQRKQKKILNLSLHYTPCLVLSSKWTVPLDKTNEFQTKQINLEINLKMWSNLVGSLRSFMGFTYRRCKWRWMPNIHLHLHSHTTHSHSLLLSFSILCHRRRRRHHHCQQHNITAPHTLLCHCKCLRKKMRLQSAIEQTYRSFQWRQHINHNFMVNTLIS